MFDTVTYCWDTRLRKLFLGPLMATPSASNTGRAHAPPVNHVASTPRVITLPALPLHTHVTGKFAVVHVSPPLRTNVSPAVGVVAAQVFAHVAMPGRCAHGVSFAAPLFVSAP